MIAAYSGIVGTSFRLFTVLLATCLSLAGCGGDKGSGRDVQLLTREPWKYEKAGFDSDEDGVFDALDPRIAGCERDNMVIFHPDGSGILREGAVKCQAGPDSLPFIWSFQNNDSTLYFQDQYYKVRTLNGSILEIYADQRLGEVKTRYIIVFKH